MDNVVQIFSPSEYTLPEIAGKINECYGVFLSSARTTIISAWDGGGWLLLAKSKLAQGEFTKWIESETQVSTRQARTWMRIHALVPKSAVTADLGIEECIQMLSSTNSHRILSTGKEGWYTPKEILRAARETMGSIDLDPASSDEAQKFVKANEWYTEEQDGLARDWSGNVWLNPPYTNGIVDRFVDKLISEYSSKRINAAILLTNNCTETG